MKERVSRYWHRSISILNNVNYHIAAVSVLIIGLFVHGNCIFSNYMMHDDLMVEGWGFGAAIRQGRWLADLLLVFKRRFLGIHVNAKGFVGTVVLILLALICCTIAYKLSIKRKTNLVLLGGVLVTFPTIVGWWGYSYMAEFFFFSIFMVAVSVVLVPIEAWKKQNIWRVILSSVLVGFSMAIYQSSICTFVAMLGVLGFQYSLELKDESWKSYLARCIGYISDCILACMVYFLSNGIALAITGNIMSSYKGLDKMSQISAAQALQRIKLAYTEFFFPSTGNLYSIYYTGIIRWIYKMSLLILLIVFMHILYIEIKQHHMRKAVQLGMIGMLLPAALNSIFLLCDADTVRTNALMMFSNVVFWICPIIVIENVRKVENRGEESINMLKAGSCVLLLLLIYEEVYFANIANVCYTKANIQQEQAIGYFNRLVGRIQGMDGYSTSLRVAYIHGENKDVEGYTYPSWNNTFAIPPFSYIVINDGAWKTYMARWCGYSPTLADDAELQYLSGLDEVREMPCYPDDGSIAVIDRYMVVKFANE